MRYMSRQTSILLFAPAWVLAGLSLADLLFATMGGATLVLGPAAGAVLAWLPRRHGAWGRVAWLAVGVNGAILVTTAAAIFALGGS
jgi:hypothetical protein